jgi:uncharacterized protein YqkB
MQWYPFEGVYGYGNGGVVDRTLGTDASVKTVFLAIYIWKRSFYQDRLGTNIGKTQKVDFFLRSFRFTIEF